MFHDTKKKKERDGECSVCYTAHDEEIHAATLRVRRWFGMQVTHSFDVETPTPE